MEKDTTCKHTSRKPGMAILTSDKIDFKVRSFAREKEGVCIMKASPIRKI